MSSLASSLLSRLQNIVAVAQPNQHDSSSNPVLLLSTPEDTKRIEKLMRLISSVLKLCSDKKLGLKNSPPFICDILPEIREHMVKILIEDSNAIKSNTYFKVFIANITSKCKETRDLFKESGDKMYDETSQGRTRLTRKTLVFSHMSHELKAQFEDGKFIGNSFKLTKQPADQFWRTHFGFRTIVPWEEFRLAIMELNGFTNEYPIYALKDTIDLTRNDHISNFEFDVFTRLFHPWDTLLINWHTLTVEHPGYMAYMTYEEVKKRLTPHLNRPGSFVFRMSCTRLGEWAIGYVACDGKIYQTIPQNKPIIQALIEGTRGKYYLFPDGCNKNVDLQKALPASSDKMVKVTSEQFELYSEIGSTFEICKICDERNKNIKLEPCGHLMCLPCLNSWVESADNGKTCPFCRSDIRGTENIVIESYRPSKAEKHVQDPNDLIRFSSPPRETAPSVRDENLVNVDFSQS
ncbi:unnamed protein product [Bursaphelenchus okinawaensis]|uniref:E3 ubiquitin-protein ligase CBL n=1 Tax=Bursaphelenchus okinawaensis TaxID=465554 RepID=A0A811KI26_9BILA|nr:unnamed protein product [Bursaphelenchus okinawaensis]CAG9105053.1 unnamed protein product [Bursaphelenchus okinawaensis]